MRDQNLAQSSYSSEISAPSFPELGKLRSAITRAVWCKRSSRSADVVLSLLHPVHRVDPAAAWAHLCLRQLRRMCLRRPDLVMLIRSLWESPCTKSKFGPITSAKRALDFWVGPGLSLKFLFLQIDPLSDGCSILVLSFSIRFVKHFERRV